MLGVTHIALENCPISKVTVDRDQRGDSGGAEQHGEGEAETLDEDGPEFFATTCLTGLCLLKCFARYILIYILCCSGRQAHHYIWGAYRYYRNKVKPSGRAYFKCSFRGCKAG